MMRGVSWYVSHCGRIWRDRSGETILHICEHWIGRSIIELVRISVEIVQFFKAVAVADVAIARGAHRMRRPFLAMKLK